MVTKGVREATDRNHSRPATSGKMNDFMLATDSIFLKIDSNNESTKSLHFPISHGELVDKS